MEQVEWIARERVVEVCRDGECLYRLDKRLYRRHLKALKKAENLDEALAEKEREVAWQCTLRALERRGLFVAELKKKLKERWVSEEGIAHAVEKGLRYGYLDDARELENRVRVGVAKGKGPRRLCMELRFVSGLPEEEIWDALPEDVWEEKAAKLIQRYNLPEDRQKASAFLARRGFSGETIQKVLRID